jgi:hypothetical protein
MLSGSFPKSACSVLASDGSDADWASSLAKRSLIFVIEKSLRSAS